MDLSYGELGEAVNKVTEKNVYEGLNFTLQLPTLDHLLQQALALHSPKLIKVDISRAFRNVPVDPRDAVKCGIQHEGQFYLDKFLVFGAVNGTMIFERISDAIRYVLGEQKVTVWNYIDDTFAAVEEKGADEKFKIVCSVIQELGLPLNPEKVQEPSDVMAIMGITVDVVSKTLSIPAAKMCEICEAVEEFSKKRYIVKESCNLF